MKTTEINQSIIGKRCECMFTGMMVKGIITEIEDCKYSVNVKVVFERVLQNSNEYFKKLQIETSHIKNRSKIRK